MIIDGAYTRVRSTPSTDLQQGELLNDFSVSPGMARRTRWCPRNPPSARRDRPWTGGAGRARRGRATANGLPNEGSVTLWAGKHEDQIGCVSAAHASRMPAMPATSLSPLIGGGVVILGHLIRFGVSIWIAMQRRQPRQHQHLDRCFDRHDVRRHWPSCRSAHCWGGGCPGWAAGRSTWSSGRA
jgi:hypothetical protein